MIQAGKGQATMFDGNEDGRQEAFVPDLVTDGEAYERALDIGEHRLDLHGGRYALPGTAELAESVAPYCRDYNAALMEYHGVTSWGGSVTQALHRMESVEYYAKILMNLRVMRAERPMTAEQIDALLALRPDWGVTGGGRPRGRN